jgi:transcriptional regulator with XRE-family HTH domain
VSKRGDAVSKTLGKRNPSVRHLAQIADALNIPIAHLFTTD